MIKLQKNLCTHCKICLKECAFNAIEFDSGYPIFGEKCVYCGLCAKLCPQNAINIELKTGFSDDLDIYSNIWVILELQTLTKSLRKVSLELLSEARVLADRLNQKVIAIGLFGSEPKELLSSLQRVGCDEIIRVKNKKLDLYDTEIYTNIISGLISQYKPTIVLFPATETGRDLAPRISARLEVGLTADCTALDIDGDKNLIQIRPTYGGNIMASIITPNHRPQMASIRPNVFIVNSVKQAKPIKLLDINIDIDKDARRVEYLDFIEKEVVFKDVSETEIIISGGYGMGCAENFKLLHNLAIKLGAAVGASRKAVDEGWAPFEIQIGQTGKTVAPELYIACGISGALQHSIGIKNAKKIIAINKDPNAPIFSMSDIAIVGNVKQILERLNEIISRRGMNEIREVGRK